MAIKVTDNARNEVLELMESSGYKDPVLRINFSGFGWGGPRMGLVLDELTVNDKNVIKDNDVNVVYDSKLKNYIDVKSSITIDFRKDRYGSGFVIQGGSSC